MPSISKITGSLAALMAVASAMPSQPKLTPRQSHIYQLSKRQNEQAVLAGLTDVDILQFALTLEWLEFTFYNQGFQQFGDDQFLALGLTSQQILDLKSLGTSEGTHVTFLQSALAQQNIQPVGPCEYNFGFTDAATMVATAGILESVGVSAYLGAAPLVTDPTILSAAGSILTIEARHETFVRAATGVTASPSPFDTPLGPKAVFTLAAPFITSCPGGSNLALTPFPTLTVTQPAEAAAGGITPLTAGTILNFQTDAGAEQALFCGFTNSANPGGTAFTAYTVESGCELPPNMAGVVYVTLTTASATDGVLTDDVTLAGPLVMQLS
jgi:hypothetical protein